MSDIEIPIVGGGARRVLVFEAVYANLHAEGCRKLSAL